MSRVEPGRIRAENLGRRFEIAAQGGRSLRATLLRREHARPREFWALRHVDLDVAPGETFGIVGRNGSGKSTLLKMLARIFGPTEGSCEVGGRLSSLLELGAGFHPEFSAVENIYLSAAIYGIPRDEVHREIESIIDFAELEEFKDQPVKTFSSGMFARLGFSVAMHVKPDVLLLDEVLAVGDEAFVRKCLGRLDDYKKTGGTMVIVSHDPRMIEQTCDRAVLLHHGAPAALGPPADVIAAYHAILEAVQDDGLPPAAPAPSPSAVEVEGWCTTLDGKRSETFSESDGMRLTLRVVPVRAVADPSIVATFKTAGGDLVGGSSTHLQELRPEQPVHVTLEVERLPLREGAFLIDVDVVDRISGRVLDQKPAVVAFAVRTQESCGFGPVALATRWLDGSDAEDLSRSVS